MIHDNTHPHKYEGMVIFNKKAKDTEIHID
jgi:hypothetical protein